MARKLSYEEVKKYIESKGCILKSKEYKGGKNKILIQCPKTQYCENNDIKLIRISYLEFDNIESILKNNLTI